MLYSIFRSVVNVSGFLILLSPPFLLDIIPLWVCCLQLPKVIYSPISIFYYKLTQINKCSTFNLTRILVQAVPDATGAFVEIGCAMWWYGRLALQCSYVSELLLSTETLHNMKRIFSQSIMNLSVFINTTRNLQIYITVMLAYV